jgi:hypothetical protein
VRLDEAEGASKLKSLLLSTASLQAGAREQSLGEQARDCQSLRLQLERGSRPWHSRPQKLRLGAQEVLSTLYKIRVESILYSEFVFVNLVQCRIRTV